MAQNLPPPAGNRSQNSSNASTSKYIPENYTTAPPPPPNTAPQSYQTRPRGPSIENQQIPSVPPTPQFFSQSPDMQASQNQRPRSRSGSYPNPPYPSNHDGHRLQAPVEPRRRSDASTHSRPSQDSRRSRRSQRSSSADDGERRSYDYDHERKHHGSHDHHHHHHHHDDNDRDLNPPKRVDSHRPTIGDTIYSLFHEIKKAINGT